MTRLSAVAYLLWSLSAWGGSPMGGDWRTTVTPSAECHTPPVCAGCHWRT